MAAEVKNIIVALKARIGNFRKKMAGAARSMGGFMKGIGKGAIKLAKFGAVAGGAAIAAAVGITYLAKKITGGLDATGKLSDRLGMSTKSLTAMRHASELAGVSAQMLDKGLEGYTRRLGDAQKGIGPTADMLNALGLDAKELAKVPLDEQRAKISDSFARIATPAEKAAAANALFGKSGLGLVTMLEQGGAAMRDNMAEADRLGISYDRGTAAMAESVQDSITRITGGLKGVGMRLLSAILPAMQSGFESIAGFISNNMPQIQAAISTALSFFGQAFEFIKNILVAVWPVASWLFEKLKAGFAVITDTVLPWVKSMFMSLVKGIVIGFTFAEAVFSNWRDALTIVFKGALLGLVKFYESVKHFLTVAIPEYLSWFGRNWRAVFTDLWSFLKTIFSNMWSNVSNFFAGLWSFLKGDGFNFEWTGLLDGFQATVEKLPAIAARGKSALERELAGDIQVAIGNIKTSFRDKLAPRLKALEDNARQSAAAKTKAIATEAKSQAAKAAGKDDSKSPAITLGDLGKKDRAGKKQSSFATLARGLSLAALAGGAGKKDRQADIAKYSRRTAMVLEKMEKRTQSGAVVFVP